GHGWNPPCVRTAIPCWAAPSRRPKGPASTARPARNVVAQAGLLERNVRPLAEGIRSIRSVPATGMIRQGGYCSLSGNVLPRTGAVLARLGRAVREGLDAVVSFSGLLLRTAPVASAIFIVSNVVTGLATPVVVWALDGLITEVSGELVQPWRQVLPWLAALSTALMLRSGEEALSEYLANVIREKVDGELYRRALRRATELPLAAFE